MHVLRARNVHEALPLAMQLLERSGTRQNSRNGLVLRTLEPVSTIYERPCERVEFHSWRDSNPFFHFYESLWMLTGRRDVTPLARYAKQMLQYSDDGQTLNAAYGHRWRQAMTWPTDGTYRPIDQLPIICDALRKDPSSRQQVLQIWDHRLDLGTQTKDHACNLMATFQVRDGCLDMVVFCRSNDVIWGAYGANAVHFSVLQEYVARRSGYEVGTYTQISVNWHAYVEVYEKMRARMLQQSQQFSPATSDDVGAMVSGVDTLGRANPYDASSSLQIAPYVIAGPGTDFARWDLDCRCFITDDGRLSQNTARVNYLPFFRDVAWPIVLAHDLYKDSPSGDKPWDLIYRTLDECQATDWRLACKMWVLRRQTRREESK